MGKPYKIKLKDGSRAHALQSPRNSTLHKSQRGLDSMEQIGVFAKVEDITPCFAGMIVVPKKECNGRICFDLKPLNESVPIRSSR